MRTKIVFAVLVAAVMVASAYGDEIGEIANMKIMDSTGTETMEFDAGDTVFFEYDIVAKQEFSAAYNTFIRGCSTGGCDGVFVTRPYIGFSVPLPKGQTQKVELEGILRSDLAEASDYKFLVYLRQDGQGDYMEIEEHKPVTIHGDPAAWEDIKLSVVSPTENCGADPDFVSAGCDAYRTIQVENLNPYNAFTGTVKVASIRGPVGDISWHSSGTDVLAPNLGAGATGTFRLDFDVADDAGEGETVMASLIGKRSDGSPLHPLYPKFIVSGNLLLVSDFLPNKGYYNPGETVSVSAGITNWGDANIIPSDNLIVRIWASWDKYGNDVIPGTDSGDTIGIASLAKKASTTVAHTFTAVPKADAPYFTLFYINLEAYLEGSPNEKITLRIPNSGVNREMVTYFVGPGSISDCVCSPDDPYTTDPPSQQCSGYKHCALILPADEDLRIAQIHVKSGSNVWWEVRDDLTAAIFLGSGNLQVEITYISAVPSFELSLFSIALLFGAALVLLGKRLRDEEGPDEQ